MKKEYKDYRKKNKSRVVEMTSHNVRVAPHVIELEQVVIGAVLLEKGAIIKLDGILISKHFYIPAHQKIMEVVLDLFRRQHPIDLLTVQEGLRKKGQLKEIGGPAYLAELTNRVASSANIEYHARIIQQHYMYRAMIAIGQEKIAVCYEAQEDVFEVLEGFEKDVMGIREGLFTREVSSIDDIVAKRLKEREEQKLKGEESGLQTYISDVDAHVSGWQKSDLIIVAARPGMGKTGFALSCILNQGRANKPVAMFSLEMSSGQLCDRLASMEAEIDGQKIRKNNLSKGEEELYFAAMTRISDYPIFIDDTPSLNIYELKAKARRLKLFNNIEAIYVDYLQLITADEFNREQQIATISRELKALAKELDIPVIALAQLSRAVETRGGTKRPQLSDLRESGQIEQDADIVIFLYRAEYYEILEDEDGRSLKGIAELIIAKFRHGGLKTIEMNFVAEFTNFKNLADENFLETVAVGEEDEILLETLDGDEVKKPYQAVILRPSKLNDDDDIPF